MPVHESEPDPSPEHTVEMEKAQFPIQRGKKSNKFAGLGSDETSLHSIEWWDISSYNIYLSYVEVTNFFPKKTAEAKIPYGLKKGGQNDEINSMSPTQSKDLCFRAYLTQINYFFLLALRNPSKVEACSEDTLQYACLQEKLQVRSSVGKLE